MENAIQKDLITPEYLSQISELHAKDESWGTSGGKWATHIARFAQDNGATSIIDYGCGKGVLLRNLRKIIPFYERIVGYDPAIEEYAEMPGPADIIACTDVLEHIEPDLVDNVLEHIAALAVKGAFLVIATTPAKAKLPDGRNAHLIIEGIDFWRPKIAERFAFVEQDTRFAPELVFKVKK